MSNGTLKNYQDVVNLLTSASGGNSVASSPHGAFWQNLTYDQFVTGCVPDPGQGHPCITNPQSNSTPVQILVKGDSAHSMIILALRGQPPFDGSVFQQMPADGPPYFSNAEIDELAAWIDANCPND